MVQQSPSSPRLGKISNWSEFLEVLEDFETIVGNHWDSEQASDLPPRLSTLGLQLAAWMTEQTRHDPNPMLDVMRAIQAKDPLGCMIAFRVPIAEVDKLLWRWWPTKELLIDAALAAGGVVPDDSATQAVGRNTKWTLARELLASEPNWNKWNTAERQRIVTKWNGLYGKSQNWTILTVKTLGELIAARRKAIKKDRLSRE